MTSYHVFSYGFDVNDFDTREEAVEWIQMMIFDALDAFKCEKLAFFAECAEAGIPFTDEWNFDNFCRFTNETIFPYTNKPFEEYTIVKVVD